MYAFKWIQSTLKDKDKLHLKKYQHKAINL